MLEFATRCRKDATATSSRRIWVSSCGRFRVVHSHCLFGPRTGRQAVPDVFHAEVRDDFGWSIISKHRERDRAVGACRRHARRERGKSR